MNTKDAVGIEYSYWLHFLNFGAFFIARIVSQSQFSLLILIWQLELHTNADGADLSLRKCIAMKDLSICLIWMNLDAKSVCMGRFFNKKWINYAFIMKKRRIIKIFMDFGWTWLRRCYISTHALVRVLRLAVREAGDPRTALASLRVLSTGRESLSNRRLAM